MKKEDLKNKYHYWKGRGSDQRYICRYYDQDGQRHDKRTRTEAEMIRFLEELEKGSVLKQTAPDFNSCYLNWFELKKYTIDVNSIQKYECEYKRHLCGTDFEKRPIDRIKKDDIVKFMILKIQHPSRKGTLSNEPLCKRSGKQLWLTIKAVFGWAFENSLIRNNPCDYIRPGKEFLCLTREHVRDPERVVISAEDLSRLNAQLEDTLQERPWYLPAYAVRLIALSGMRPGEAAVLRWEDLIEIPGRGRFLRICRHESLDKISREMREKNTPKNGRERLIPVTPEIDDLLGDVMRVTGMPTGWLFPAGSGHITQAAISSCMRNKCAQAGILDRGCYTLRRTVNSRLRAAGMDASAAASLLGNTPSVNTQYYTFDVMEPEDKRSRLSDVGRSMM